MNNYEKFKHAMVLSKEQNYRELRKEIKIIESAIENFLQRALECTAVMSEKDFFVTPL